MKKIISIAVEPEQANAIKLLKEATRSRSVSALIRRALHAYAKAESPTLAEPFTTRNERTSIRFTGKGATNHPPRRRHPR